MDSSGDDPEVNAMQTLVRELGRLPEDARTRVISWAATRWGVSLAKRPPSLGGKGHDTEDDEHDTTEFKTFPELYDAARPDSEAMRALVTGFWFQIVQKQADFSGQQVNDALKDLGHPLSNVTVAFRNLQERTPVLARQVKKSGTSKQARKRYQITQAGAKEVEAMIRGEKKKEE